MKKIIVMLMLLAPITMWAQQKFGHINTQQVINDMPEFVKVRGELEAIAKQYENDLQAMQQEFQRKAEEYEKTRSTMNATKQQETEQSLVDLQEKIRTAYNDNSQALQRQQAEKMQPIQAKVVNAIEAVGKAGKYVYIMDVAAGIPFINPAFSDDVTSQVKAELAKAK